jgi:gas vesicle protein
MPLYNEAVYNNTIKAIENVKNFNANSLAKLDDLRQQNNFPKAVQLAKDIIDLYLPVCPEALKTFSDVPLYKIRDNADSIYNNFTEICKFQFIDQDNPEIAKNNYINQLKKLYNETFELLRGVISYSICRGSANNFRHLEEKAKGVFEKIEAQASKVTKEVETFKIETENVLKTTVKKLETNKKEAEDILEEIKQVAVDQAVSKQATYFKNEGDKHLKKVKFWGVAVFITAVFVIGFALFSLFFHKIDILKPTDKLEMMQLIASKLFIFSTLTYLLYICGKNFSNHKHNAILNKHRQNSLMTYKALVEAAGTSEGKEIILRQAANSIFTHQDTGYIKNGQNDTGKGIMDLLLKKNFKLD